MIVVIVAAMQAREMTQIGSGLVRGDVALAILSDGHDIVLEGSKHEFHEIEKEDGHVSMSQDSSLL